MSLSVIPLTILGQITGVTGSGDTALYQVSFKSIDGTPLYGVTAVWTDEQAEIEALAAEKPYGVWINPIDGTFTVKFAGYTYVGSADLTDADVLAGVTPIEFTASDVSDRLLPEVTAEDDGKILQVVDGNWEVQSADYIQTTTFFNDDATVAELSVGAYGFDLGPIEGFGGLVKTVTLSISNETETITDTLELDLIDDEWRGDHFMLTYRDPDYSLTRLDGFDEADLGDIYDVTLTAENVNSNFINATDKALTRTIKISLESAEILNLMGTGKLTHKDITDEADFYGLRMDNAISYKIEILVPGSSISLIPSGIGQVNLDPRVIYTGYFFTNPSSLTQLVFFNSFIYEDDSKMYLDIYCASATTTPGFTIS